MENAKTISVLKARMKYLESVIENDILTEGENTEYESLIHAIKAIKYMERVEGISEEEIEEIISESTLTELAHKRWMTHRQQYLERAFNTEIIPVAKAIKALIGGEER